MNRFAPTTVLIAFLALPAAGLAKPGFDPSEIEEDVSLVEELLEWPDITFPEPAERGRGFKPGETFTFRAQWGLFRKAGEMEITTRLEQSPEGPKLIVRTQTHSKGLIRAFYPLTMDAFATLDAEKWRMDRLTVTGGARSKMTDTVAVYDYGAGSMTYTQRGEAEPPTVKTIPYPVPLDYASGLLRARAWDFESGENYPLLISTKSRFYYIEMKLIQREIIETDLGKIDAYRLEPVKAYPRSRIFDEGGRLAIWISADERRLPLRFDLETKVGMASMRLSSYELASPLIVGK